MTIKLLHAAPAHLAAQAAALCTGSKNPARAMESAIERGHGSIAEHCNYTFSVEGVSRVLLAQLTRHRIASFSVQSQRYCGVKPEWVMPPSIAADADRAERYKVICTACYCSYTALIDQGVPEEDARYIIPQGVTCNLQMTMNARELMHFFSLRCCNRAQWEIREMAWEMLRLCREAAPELFRHAGPGCLTGGCPEGKVSCRNPYRRDTDDADA